MVPHVNREFIGSLGNIKSTTWKPLSANTIIEFILTGAIDHDTAIAMVEAGRVKETKLVKEIWKAVKGCTTVEEQKNTIKRTFPILKTLQAI